MQDFPLFTTEHGVASIVLKEVPYKGIAYITIQDTLQPEQLLQDCVDFCKMTGAREIYATGHPYLECYSLYTETWQMSRLRAGMAETDAALFPVTEKSMEQWRGLYNEKMMHIPNSATMTRADAEKLLARGGGYFVYRGDALLGIGIAYDEMIEAVIGLQTGAGREVMLALCSSLSAQRVALEVASSNLPAVKLYEKLGFLKTGVISRWYDVLTRKNT